MHIQIWESTAITSPPNHDIPDPHYIKIHNNGVEYVIKAISDGIQISVSGQMIVVPGASNVVSFKEKKREYSE